MLIKRNWLLGLRIQHDVLKEKRAEYGQQVVKNLSQSLTDKYGRGFLLANIYHFISFYSNHPDFFYAVSRKSYDTDLDIFHAVSRKSDIFHALHAKYPIRLTWTHYRIILQPEHQLPLEVPSLLRVGSRQPLLW